ncbi:Clc protein-like family-containing protein [Strongyloides ratti]|uniref:Clc protein-like family-containing protein n=1 Tax=Strongyloides ratti TaxID=34506 RepID=A0A090LU39_STRRB|nr:Clc protein-like family-containing protein [Strongyloides ratti]CEF71149.1 Clc protein-like family-containing protein [Strongyloides ratti]
MCKIFVGTITSILTILGITLMLLAIITPAWQVVTLTDLHVIHEHGLWLDCSSTNPTFSDIFSSDHKCTNKFINFEFTKNDNNVKLDNGDANSHKLHKWHQVMLILFGSSIILAVIGQTFLFCAFCFPISGVVANLFLLLSFFTASMAMVIFHIYTNKTEFRFISVMLNVYEQKTGYSSIIGLLSVLILMIAFLISIILSVLLFIQDRNKHNISKTFPNFSTSV